MTTDTERAQVGEGADGVVVPREGQPTDWFAEWGKPWSVLDALKHARMLLARRGESDARIDAALARGVAPSDGSQPTDTQMLDFIASEYLDVTAFSMPTGAGDADVGWKLTQEHEGKKGRVEVAIHYCDDLRAAIREAMKNLGWLKRTHGVMASDAQSITGSDERLRFAQRVLESSGTPTQQDREAAARGLRDLRRDLYTLGVPVVHEAQPVAWRFKLREDGDWHLDEEKPHHPERLHCVEPLYAHAGVMASDGSKPE